MKHQIKSLNKSRSFGSLSNYRSKKNSDTFKYNSSDPGFLIPTLFNSKENQSSSNFKLCEEERKDSKLLLSENQKRIRKQKKVLILDLDDTLIHSIEAIPNKLSFTTSIKPQKIRWKVKLDQKIKKKLPKNIIKDKTTLNQDSFFADYNIINLRYHNRYFYVCERPNVRQFLHSVLDLFEVYIYTSSDKQYAKPIIDELCPMIDDSHRKYGNLCKIKYNRIYKDLFSFNCPFNDILIVDDNKEIFFFWPKNSILCKPFNFKSINGQNEEEFDDENNCTNLNYNGEDIALFIDQNYLMGKLLPFLVKCASVKDARKVINSYDALNIHQFNENNDGICFNGHPNALYK